MVERESHAESVTARIVRPGAITEVVGRLSSGRTSLLLACLRDHTRAGAVVALVDADQAFDPGSAARAGIDLRRLLWVRCGGRRDVALRATDLLARCPGFALIGLDVGESPPRLPLAGAFRLKLAVRRSGAALLVVSARRITGAAATLAQKGGSICMVGSAQPPRAWRMRSRLSVLRTSRRPASGLSPPAPLQPRLAEARGRGISEGRAVSRCTGWLRWSDRVSRYACVLVRTAAAAAGGRARLRSPFAIVTGAPPATRVVEANAAAREHGVAPGMPEAEARTRCPVLALRSATPELVDSSTQALLQACLGVSPRIEEAGPGIVHVEMDGLERLFGSDAAIAHRLARLPHTDCPRASEWPTAGWPRAWPRAGRAPAWRWFLPEAIDSRSPLPPSTRWISPTCSISIHELASSRWWMTICYRRTGE
jgi:hypothetical protein